MALSLRSKRFRLVSEQRKTEEQDSRVWPREKWNKSQKMKVRSLTLLPRSFLLNRTETLATQAIWLLTKMLYKKANGIESLLM